MSRTDRAVARFTEGFMCSQAVFSAFAEDLGLSEEVALKIAEPFGGGICSMGHECGAVTGALMVVGLKYGRSQPDDLQAKEKSKAIARQVTRQFESRHGSIMCRELLECDISDETELQRAREEGLFKKRCPAFVSTATEIVESLLVD